MVKCLGGKMSGWPNVGVAKCVGGRMSGYELSGCRLSGCHLSVNHAACLEMLSFLFTSG